MAQCWGSDFVYQPFMAECWQFLFCRFKMCGFMMSSPVSVLNYWCLKHLREHRAEQTPGTGSWSQIISFHSLMSRLNPILIGRKSLETWIKWDGSKAWIPARQGCTFGKERPSSMISTRPFLGVTLATQKTEAGGMTQQYALASNVPVVTFFRQRAQGYSRGLPFLFHCKAEKQHARSWPCRFHLLYSLGRFGWWILRVLGIRADVWTVFGLSNK